MNYEEIIENLEIESVKNLLHSLEIPFKEVDNALIMPTVCHNEDVDEASWKLYYYKDTHIFYCYTECSEAMSIFKFLKKYYETRNIEYDWYQDILQVILNCSAAKNYSYKKTYKSNIEKYRAADEKKIEIYPKGLIDCFIKYYPIEWLNDGISKNAMDKYNIRFNNEMNKIIIPHYNIDNELIGVRGRALNEWEIENIGKYLPVQIENKWYSHPLSLNLYGLNQTKENIKENGICYIVEAEKSVLQAESFKIPNCCAAVCGSNLNKYQIKLLIKRLRPKEIVLCFDQEELPHKDEYFNKLYSICQKYKNYAQMSFVYDRNNLLNLKESPTDKGEEIFKELLSRRVKV